MRKGLHKKFLASLMAFALAVPAVSISPLADVQVALAADDDVLDKVLGADDITLRMKWNDKSNVGTGHSVTMSDGSTITVKDNGTVRKELTASQLADTEMGMGVNLGNTLEAPQPLDKKATLGKTGYDTLWQQPVTTREYIDCLHSYGINTLRIPVSWSNGDIDDGNYNIRNELFDRVEEVMNYALDNGMYVIINDHYDNDWWGQFGACKKDADGNKIADEETRKQAWIRYEKYWTQICEHFKNYSDHLIFESANEELSEKLNNPICLSGPAKGYPSYASTDENVEVLGGNLSNDELYSTTNEINQKFVDIVRKSGGNNTNRHLLIAGFGTDIDKTADERFKMPEDISENGTNKLFLSVHYYTPWSFCGDDQSGTYTVKDQKATAEKEPGSSTTVQVSDYIDSALWSTPGIHAYLSYQTSTWDYRNSYKPLKDLGNGEHSWDFAQAAGNEVNSANTKITDVQITADGEYKVAIDGIDLSAANTYNVLCISTDIKKELYPGITVTDAVLKVDGKDVTDAPVTPVVESDDDYYKFMLVNKWGADSYPLASLNDSEKLAIPAKSMEITFKINGLNTALADIASGEYINPETGLKISGTNTNEPGTTEPGQPEENKNLKKGDVFTNSNFKYKVTKAASGSTDGNATLTGLSTKGSKAKKLSVALSVKGTDGNSYKITAIRKKAFSGAKAAAVTLNKNIKNIPALAFQNCTNLNTLTLKAKLSKAAKNSFKGCKNTITVKGTSGKANKKLLKKTSYKKFK